MERKNRETKIVETDRKQQNGRTEFNIPIIISNVNESNIPIKRQELPECILKRRPFFNGVLSKRDALEEWLY